MDLILVQAQLERLLRQLSRVPLRLNDSTRLIRIRNVIESYSDSNLLVGTLKKEALQERHWQQPFTAMLPDYTYSATAMTLGDVWELDLPKNQKLVQEVILQANGEMQLQNLLREVEESWTGLTLELGNYHGNPVLLQNLEIVLTNFTIL